MWSDIKDMCDKPYEFIKTQQPFIC